MDLEPLFLFFLLFIKILEPWIFIEKKKYILSASLVVIIDNGYQFPRQTAWKKPFFSLGSQEYF